MYYVRIDNGNGEQILYSPIAVNDGFVILEPKLKSELNKALSFTFLLPPTNPHYNDISKLKTIITVYDDTELVFRGRCREATKSFNNCIDVECESDLAFLGDVDTDKYDASKTASGWIDYFLGLYNDIAPTEREITKGTVRSISSFALSNDSESNVLDELLEITNKKGGMLRTRVDNGSVKLDYLAIESSPAQDAQVIRFGKNLIDFEQFIDASDIITRVKAYGKETTENNVTTVVGPVTVTNTNAETLFGTRVLRIVKFSEAENTTDLTSFATAYLNKNVSMSITIKLSAVDLHLLDVNEKKLEVGKRNRIISAAHGFDESYVCSRIELDLADPSKNTYEFGDKRYTLTEKVTYNTPVLRR